MSAPETKIIAQAQARLMRAGFKLATAIKIVLSRQGRFDFGKGKFAAGSRRLNPKYRAPLDRRLTRNSRFPGVSFSKGKTFGFEGRYSPKGNLLGLVGRSRPGEPPLFQSGRLRNSMSVARIDATTVRVGTNVRYAPYLEFGVRGGKVILAKEKKSLYDPVSGRFFGKRVIQGAIRPRPFFRPTVNRMRAEIVQTIAGAA